MALAPAHVQQREDAAVGAALRRAIAALPTGWYISLEFGTSRHWFATAAPKFRPGEGHLEHGFEAAVALSGVADWLEARPWGDAKHEHCWRQHDDGQRCLDCGAER